MKELKCESYNWYICDHFFYNIKVIGFKTQWWVWNMNTIVYQNVLNQLDAIL